MAQIFILYLIMPYRNVQKKKQDTMSPAGIVSPPGFTAESLWTSISNSGARSLVDRFYSTRPTETPGIPILASSTTSLSPDLEFKIKHLTSEILTSTDRIVREHWVPELTTLFVSLSAQLTTVKDNFEKEVVRSADSQAINEALKKELVVKEEALAATTTMLNAQRTKLEFAQLNLRKKDQRLCEHNKKMYFKNQELYAKDQEIRAKEKEIYFKDLELHEKHWAGETNNACFARNPELLSRFIARARSERLSGTSDEGSGSSVGHGSSIFNTQRADLDKAFAELVHLLTVEEHRTSSLRDLLNQSIVEVGRLKICLEEATGQNLPPLPGNVHLANTRSGPKTQRLNTQIAEFNEEVAQEAYFLNVEKPRSSGLRNLPNNSIDQFGGSKSFVGGDTDVVRNSLESMPERRDSSDKDAGNTSEPSMATTQDNNEEHPIVHVSDGALL
ncbi:hypothetical protein L873DRAFT_402887 [Choiromyces venosus 120613-1]|uniref:Uncharacterized protein n=1 Tax=Choiromyces venosus 120613-1 TaxID=1336337 RepID=A0A3N4IWM5_9PEZI|nr:hypothetical protein L873DRAFT_402887 [Choiromyces venosus 120613-1]